MAAERVLNLTSWERFSSVWRKSPYLVCLLRFHWLTLQTCSCLLHCQVADQHFAIFPPTIDLLQFHCRLTHGRTCCRSVLSCICVLSAILASWTQVRCFSKCDPAATCSLSSYGAHTDRLAGCCGLTIHCRCFTTLRQSLLLPPHTLLSLLRLLHHLHLQSRIVPRSSLVQ